MGSKQQKKSTYWISKSVMYSTNFQDIKSKNVNIQQESSLLGNIHKLSFQDC